MRLTALVEAILDITVTIIAIYPAGVELQLQNKCHLCRIIDFRLLFFEVCDN